MATQRRVPTQKRAQLTQQAVVTGAARVFDRVGYGNTSLSMIAEASGISQGSMYFHFKSKEQIALAIIREQHNRSLPLMAKARGPYSGTIETLVRASHSMVEQLRNDVVVRAGIRLALDDGALSEPAGGFYEDWISATASLLEPALLNGELRSRLSSAELARILIGFFTGVQLTSQATTGREDLLESVRRMWLLILDAIVPDNHRPEATRVLDEVFPESESSRASISK